MLINNPIERRITFDPIPHKYSDEIGSKYTSVTTVIESIAEEFDKELWSIYKALEAYKYSPRVNTKDRTICPVPHKNRVYYPISHFLTMPKLVTKAAEIIAEWQVINDVACERGNKIHDYLEDCIKSFQGTTEFNTVSAVTRHDIDRDFYLRITNIKELESSPLKYIHNEIYQHLCREINDGWVIFAEKRVYLWEVLLSGTIDVLLVRGKEFKIADWKTNKDKMHFQAGYYKKIKTIADDGSIKKVRTGEWVLNAKKLEAPLGHLESCKGIKYSLQVSLYAYMVEVWGLECVGLKIFHIRPKETFNEMTQEMESEEIVEEHDIEYMKNDIELLIKPRLKLTP
jgi:hypothetical protein